MDSGRAEVRGTVDREVGEPAVGDAAAGEAAAGGGTHAGAGGGVVDGTETERELVGSSIVSRAERRWRSGA
ncbi:hypothetical protein KIN34_10380 [Cellulomonas sp. DKR-3]|uniref:Uncharacterized protein n=1 Tax=Cellulomonas fulva TaxID=2835530 RepID=A0ABS5U025_9CELL|nr:hypothetical protein [Cellulomonas fulva]MBT0994692.1 hypothetical protein [Cellulomonas fulva]